MKRILCLVIAVLFCVSLAACGTRSSSSAEATPAAASVPANLTEAPTFESSEAEEITTTEAEPEKEPDYQLDGLTVDAAMDFRNGYTWLQMDGCSVLVNREGEEQFSLDQMILYGSPVDETGTTFVVYQDGSDYRETIYDVTGRERYSTSKIETSTGLTEEHILVQGDGKYVTARHASGLTADGWTFGTIDADGNVIDKYQSYIHYGDKQLDESCLPVWSDSEGLPLTYEVLSDNLFMGNARLLPRYLGEGIFFFPRDEVFFVPETQTMMFGNHDIPIGPAENGIVLTDNKSFNLQSQEVVYGISTDPVVFEFSGNVSFDLNTRFSEGMFFSENDFYDIHGNLALKISEYRDRPKVCSAFSDGYAIMILNGADGNNYVTMIDRNGATQFEPFQIKDISANTQGGLFAACTETGWAVYNYDGSLIRTLPEYDYTYLVRFSEGFLRIGHYATINKRSKAVQTLFAVPYNP